MNEEWPKPWDEIKSVDGSTEVNGEFLFADSMVHTIVDLGPIRCYDDTVYINTNAGEHDKALSELWMPLGVYFKRGVDESAE